MEQVKIQQIKNETTFRYGIFAIVFTLFSPVAIYAFNKTFESEIYNYKLNKENNENVEKYGTLQQAKLKELKEKDLQNENK